MICVFNIRSAKTNEGVNDLFQKLIDEVIRREALN